jgi:hypothetical protein
MEYERLTSLAAGRLGTPAGGPKNIVPSPYPAQGPWSPLSLSTQKAKQYRPTKRTKLTMTNKIFKIEFSKLLNMIWGTLSNLKIFACCPVRSGLMAQQLILELCAIFCKKTNFLLL